MLIYICMLILMFNEESISTTSIKTYETIELKENIPINSRVMELKMNKSSKLILLNMGGFELNLFKIVNESIYTINEIDREKLVGEKRCFDRLYCLIELHILVDDGNQYLVIPIHILDENDNKPEFERSEIELKFNENIIGGYQIPFLGAKDIDEGKNSEIEYILNGLKEDLLMFELIILSKSFSSINFDQLALKYNPMSSSLNNKSEFELIVYGINLNLNNSMKINIKIEKNILNNKIEFSSNEYKFILINNQQKQIGFVNIKSSSSNDIVYKIINKTNENIQINSLTGELTLINSSSSNLNEINLIIQASSLKNPEKKIFTNVKIFFRNNLKEISVKFDLISPSIEQFENNNSFLINENIKLNEVLFHLSIISNYYPDDQYIIFLDNYFTTFSLLPSSSSLNKYLLKINSITKSIYYLRIRIKHQLSNQWLNNLTIKLNFLNENICVKNQIFILQDFNQNFIGKFKVMKTNLNISSFSTFSINQDEILIDQCQMLVIKQINYDFNSSEYQLCSLNHLCYNLTFIQPKPQFIRSSNKEILFKPIEITIFALSLVFIMATLTLFIIICRLKGIHLCLNVKNYLFYGKKYGLSNAQRLSSNKITQRIHSIVVRESQSPSVQLNKSHQFNIDHFTEQEPIPSINLNYHYSPSEPFSLSLASSLQREDRTKSNIENEITPRTSLFVQDSKQLLEMISSNQDLDLSRLASEV